ncbi:MAG: peptide chain release factor N(5)-glutamine methyltransferase [Patescibacteria group bacterium]|nr:peptide chain release factor N(5)-glutamine methyltransferase [Patescibacteria group bacterium]
MTNTLDILRRSILELKKAGIKSAEIDAKLLLTKSISKDDVFMFSHPEYLLTNQEYGGFRRLIRKRKTGEPIAYILGHKEFYGNDFIVNKNVLIPRPETEWLVERGIEFIKKRHSEPEFSGEESQPSKKDPSVSPQDDNIQVLDMGTGSGCIIISLVKELTTYNLQLNTNFYACDISKKAIAVTKKNSKLHKVDNYVKFYVSNLFSNRLLNKKFDLIIANLPYVPRSKIQSPKLSFESEPESSSLRVEDKVLNPISFEPRNAIFAKDNGAEIIKNFLEQAQSRIAPNGLILLELDPRNAKEILSFAKKQYPNAKVKLEKDLAKLDRYIKISV